MGFPAKMMDITQYPLAITLFRAVCIMMIAEHLPYLIHEFEAGIRVELRFVFILTFHDSSHTIAINGN